MRPGRLQRAEEPARSGKLCCAAVGGSPRLPRGEQTGAGRGSGRQRRFPGRATVRQCGLGWSGGREAVG